MEKYLWDRRRGVSVKERESRRDMHEHTLPHRPDDDSPYEPPRYTFTIVDEPIALVGHNVAP